MRGQFHLLKPVVKRDNERITKTFLFPETVVQPAENPSCLVCADEQMQSVT